MKPCAIAILQNPIKNKWMVTTTIGWECPHKNDGSIKLIGIDKFGVRHKDLTQTEAIQVADVYNSYLLDEKKNKTKKLPPVRSV